MRLLGSQFGLLYPGNIEFLDTLEVQDVYGFPLFQTITWSFKNLYFYKLITQVHLKIPCRLTNSIVVANVEKFESGNYFVIGASSLG